MFQMETPFDKPIYPLEGTKVAAQVRRPPKYANPSDDPRVEQMMVFCIFQEMRALASVQDKRTTPEEDARHAELMLSNTYNTQLRHSS